MGADFTPPAAAARAANLKTRNSRPIMVAIGGAGSAVGGNLTSRERFEVALDTLVEDIKLDEHVLAVILSGSLSHDEVWDKSDIDLFVICTDDKKTKLHNVALVEDDINIHTTVQPRADFRQQLESSVRNTFGHSMFAKSKIIFSNDPSIDQMFEELQQVGARDSQVQVMGSAQAALVTLYKARKWYEIKDDPEYTAMWILRTATALAEVQVGLSGEIVGREAIIDAVRLNPELFEAIYLNLLQRKVTRKSLTLALDSIDAYLEPKARFIFEPVLEYLNETGGEPRSSTEISHYFRRNFGMDHVIIACEWLSDIGLIEKASTPVKLTTRSQVEVEELAFFHLAS